MRMGTRLRGAVKILIPLIVSSRPSDNAMQATLRKYQNGINRAMKYVAHTAQETRPQRAQMCVICDLCFVPRIISQPLLNFLLPVLHETVERQLDTVDMLQEFNLTGQTTIIFLQIGFRLRVDGSNSLNIMQKLTDLCRCHKHCKTHIDWVKQVNISVID